MSQEVGCHGNIPMEMEALAFFNSDKSGGGGDKPCNEPPELPSNIPTMVTATAAPECSQRRTKKANITAGEVNGTADSGGHFDKERRKKMRTMYSGLQALLPRLPEQAVEMEILDEAISYIKTLQDTLGKLEKKKRERSQGRTSQQVNPPAESREASVADQVKSLPGAKAPAAVSASPPPVGFQTWSSPNVAVSVAGEEAHINIYTASKPGLLTTITHTLDRHNLEVVTAHVSSNGVNRFFMIHAHAKSVSDQLRKAHEIEDNFKLAIAEIILFMSE